MIGIDSRGYLYIVNQKKIEVLKCLWEYQVCSYWNYKEEERRFLDEMLHKGWLQIDGHLLSRPERDFFSYYLDNRSFTNGMAYRNLYAHGSTSPAYDENTHLKAYISFLMLLSIIIIKIENDLWLSEKIALIEFLKNINNIES